MSRLLFISFHHQNSGNMASKAMLVVLRYGKLLQEPVIHLRNYGHFSSLKKNSRHLILTLINSRRTSNTNDFNKKWFEEMRKLSVAPSEDKKSIIIESQNEKKMRLEIESLTREVEVATEKEQLMNDKYKRALADGENLRKRLTKQIHYAKIFSIQRFCKDLLEVADALGTARESVPAEEMINKGNLYLKSLYEGLTMTEIQLQKVFKEHGLEVVNPINEKFDPYFHEALFQQEIPGKEPGIVIKVSKIGYKLQERVVRPALVGIAKGS